MGRHVRRLQPKCSANRWIRFKIGRRTLELSIASEINDSLADVFCSPLQCLSLSTIKGKPLSRFHCWYKLLWNDPSAPYSFQVHHSCLSCIPMEMFRHQHWIEIVSTFTVHPKPMASGAGKYVVEITLLLLYVILKVDIISFFIYNTIERSLQLPLVQFFFVCSKHQDPGRPRKPATPTCKTLGRNGIRSFHDDSKRERERERAFTCSTHNTPVCKELRPHYPSSCWRFVMHPI